MVGWRCFADGSVEPVDVDDYMVMHDRIISELLLDITDLIHDVELLKAQIICDRITDDIFDITDLVDQPDLECVRYDGRAGSGG